MKIMMITLILAGILFAADNNNATIELKPIPGKNTITYHMSHPLHKFDASSKSMRMQALWNGQTKTLERLTIVADVIKFDSQNSNRDSHAMEVIEAIKFPTAKFVSTSIEQNGDKLKVMGNLTFHGITQPISLEAAQVKGASLIYEGHFDISLDAFKIERPSLMFMPVDNDLKFDVHLEFTTPLS